MDILLILSLNTDENNVIDESFVGLHPLLLPI